MSQPYKAYRGWMECKDRKFDLASLFFILVLLFNEIDRFTFLSTDITYAIVILIRVIET